MTTYLLDTSALIANPTAYLDFHNSEVILPITVLDELDKLKKLPNEAGKNARVAIRKLDEISKDADLSAGIKLDNSILLKIDVNNYPVTGDALYGDTRILACAKAYTNVVVVSNDLNMRVRARASGMKSESYDKNAAPNDLYSGIQYITSDNDRLITDLSAKVGAKPSDLGIKLNPNECIIVRDNAGKDIAKARKTSKDILRSVKKQVPWGLEAKNSEQELAIDLLLDTRIPLVTFIGNAGTGKSILALACGLELVLEKKIYERMIIYRPTVSIDEGIGWLPGTLSEKMAPWMQPIMDNLEVLMNENGEGKAKTMIEMYLKKGKLEFDALSFIRGRSIPNTFVLFDEAQNCSAAQIKTVLSRIGQNTKIVLTGDISQIDNKDLDPTDNGLSYVIEKFKTNALSGHIAFTKGERSPLATAAAELL
jgi:PhoH-like ATPase